MASNGDRSDGSSDNSTWRLDDGDKPRPASATGGTDEHESVLDRFIDSFLRAIDVEMDAMRERMGPFEVPLAQGHLLDRGNGGKGPLLYRFGFLQSNDKLVLDAECTLVAGLQEHLVVITSIDGGDLVLRSEREEIDLSADTFSLVIYPWFLYQRLKVVLQSLSHDPDSYYTANALALFGKAPPRELPADPFAPQSQFADLNSSQLSALEMCCNRTPAFVWGPPGTGKTTTLGHIVTALLHRGQRILVTSTTNAAVDQALAKLAGLEAAAEALERGEIVRVGQTQAETFGAGLQQVVERLDTRTGERLTRVKQRQRELQNQLELCERALELLDGAAQPRQLGLFENDLPPSELSHRLLDGIFTSPGRVRAILGLAPEQQRALVARRQHRLTSCLELYRERATQHHRERRHREAGVVDGARVILATMTNVYISALLQPQRFDVVIVEEASMAILPTLFYCASLSRNRLIMVGDPRQLPPIVQSPQPYVYRAMGRSIFEVTVPNPHDSDLVVMLETQYRMHPAIGDLVGGLFYDGRLRHATSGGESLDTAPNELGQAPMKTSDISAREPNPGAPLVVVDTGGRTVCATREGSFSRYNEQTATACVELAARAVGDGVESVAIITPYAEQARLVRRLLAAAASSLGEPNLAQRVECRTVHRFQGGERDLVIFDTVDAAPFRPGVLLTGKGPGSCAANLINVSISRARGKLVIVSDVEYFSRHDPAGVISNMLRRAAETGLCVSLEDSTRTDPM